ncbi:MAG: orotidine-5'-phosphate decarboxylase [Lacibacter sp.]|jgi:orotidine-5'-phosphate decarboxylase
MTRQQLVQHIRSKKSYLCVGLDTDPEKIPATFRSRPDGVVAFNKAIIDATRDFCVGYKINTAFYEAQGIKGWEAMEETVHYIPDTHFKIADAKRGDIGNTSAQYAKAFFERLPFDAVTVAPYMGEDSIRPFLEYPQKWTIVLGLTSNKGAADFELLPVGNTPPLEKAELLYERVMRRVSAWGTPDNLMFVVGATQPAEFVNIRRILPDHFLLVPGVGAQGGSLAVISTHAMNADCGLLVNVSRAIIFAGNDLDFAEEAGRVAQSYHIEMQRYMG